MKEDLEKIAYHLHKNEIPLAKELAKPYYKEPPKYETGTPGEFWNSCVPEQKIKAVLKKFNPGASYPFLTYEMGGYEFFRPMPKPLDIGDNVKLKEDYKTVKKGEVFNISEKNQKGFWVAKFGDYGFLEFPEEILERTEQ